MALVLKEAEICNGGIRDPMRRRCGDIVEQKGRIVNGFRFSEIGSFASLRLLRAARRPYARAHFGEKDSVHHKSWEPTTCESLRHKIWST
jgi:hypothetical protein